MADKQKLRRIPQKGLHWTQQYANVGDQIRVYPLLGDGTPFVATVGKVVRNKHGRVSYFYYETDSQLVLTEELTPLLHKGVTR